ncbi:hypothetical protein LJC27_06640 [Christensenellaceae bacterium OttesenSCG-928-M15]|nr:hypothetical protein [Christensenellaceae bacterium OttesenSCG-928-M15]
MEKPIKIWALLRKKQKIVADVVLEFVRPDDEQSWQETIGALSTALQQSRPVLLSKHFDQLEQFRRTIFYPSDFVETVDFDKMEIELFPEKTEKQTK